MGVLNSLGILPQPKKAQAATQQPQTVNDALTQAQNKTDAIDTKTEGDITNAFAKARTATAATQDVAKQNMANDLDRQQAAQPGGFGGAALKIRQKAIAEAERGFAGDQASLDAQEAQAKAALGEAKAGRAMSFGQLGLQNEQFKSTMNYQYAELDENKKTNLINALTALKDAGFLDNSVDELNNFYRSGLSSIYGGRVPQNQGSTTLGAFGKPMYAAPGSGDYKYV